MKTNKWLLLILIIVILSSCLHCESFNSVQDDKEHDVFTFYTILESDLSTYNLHIKADFCSIRTLSLCVKDNQCVEEVLGNRSIQMIAKNGPRHTEKTDRRDMLFQYYVTNQTNFYEKNLNRRGPFNDTFINSRKRILSYIHNQDGEKG